MIIASSGVVLTKLLKCELAIIASSGIMLTKLYWLYSFRVRKSREDYLREDLESCSTSGIGRIQRSVHAKSFIF